MITDLAKAKTGAASRTKHRVDYLSLPTTTAGGIAADKLSGWILR
jgi:hypothetical protein